MEQELETVGRGWGGPPVLSSVMRVVLWLLPVFLWISLSLAAREAGPRAPAAEPPLAPVPQHHFWDRTNILLFSGVAVSRALDYTSTKHFLARGNNEVLIPDDVVKNSAGFAALEAAGAGTSGGVSFIFPRTRTHKIGRRRFVRHNTLDRGGVGLYYLSAGEEQLV